MHTQGQWGHSPKTTPLNHHQGHWNRNNRRSDSNLWGNNSPKQRESECTNYSRRKASNPSEATCFMGDLADGYYSTRYETQIDNRIPHLDLSWMRLRPLQGAFSRSGLCARCSIFLHHAEESQLGRNCQSETQTVQNVIWERKRKEKETFRCLCLCVRLCLCLRQGRFHGELNKNYCVCACACVSSEKKAFHATISNGNRTEWSPVRSVWFSLDRIALRFWLRLWLRLRH